MLLTPSKAPLLKMNGLFFTDLPPVPQIDPAGMIVPVTIHHSKFKIQKLPYPLLFTSKATAAPPQSNIQHSTFNIYHQLPSCLMWNSIMET